MTNDIAGEDVTTGKGGCILRFSERPHGMEREVIKEITLTLFQWHCDRQVFMMCRVPGAHLEHREGEFERPEQVTPAAT